MPNPIQHHLNTNTPPQSTNPSESTILVDSNIQTVSNQPRPSRHHLYPNLSQCNSKRGDTKNFNRQQPTKNQNLEIQQIEDNRNNKNFNELFHLRQQLEKNSTNESKETIQTRLKRIFALIRKSHNQIIQNNNDIRNASKRITTWLNTQQKELLKYQYPIHNNITQLREQLVTLNNETQTQEKENEESLSSMSSCISYTDDPSNNDFTTTITELYDKFNIDQKNPHLNNTERLQLLNISVFSVAIDHLLKQLTRQEEKKIIFKISEDISKKTTSSIDDTDKTIQGITESLNTLSLNAQNNSVSSLESSASSIQHSLNQEGLACSRRPYNSSLPSKDSSTKKVATSIFYPPKTTASPLHPSSQQSTRFHQFQSIPYQPTASLHPSSQQSTRLSQSIPYQPTASLHPSSQQSTESPLASYVFKNNEITFPSDSTPVIAPSPPQKASSQQLRSQRLSTPSALESQAITFPSDSTPVIAPSSPQKASSQQLRSQPHSIHQQPHQSQPDDQSESFDYVSSPIINLMSDYESSLMATSTESSRLRSQSETNSSSSFIVIDSTSG